LIHESWPWKRELLGDADVLERWLQKPLTERRGFIIEKKVFLAAYTMRKLLQAGKLSTARLERSIGCKLYPARSGVPPRRVSSYLDGYYDFSAASLVQVPARKLLDMIIHSFIFAEGLDDTHRVASFLVTSDVTREHGLWDVPFASFLRIMRKVGRDDPSRSVSAFDPETGQWVTWAGNGEPPRHVMKKIDQIRARQGLTRPFADIASSSERGLPPP
jgi:hypothetical protein